MFLICWQWFLFCFSAYFVHFSWVSFFHYKWFYGKGTGDWKPEGGFLLVFLQQFICVLLRFLHFCYFWVLQESMFNCVLILTCYAAVFYCIFQSVVVVYWHHHMIAYCVFLFNNVWTAIQSSLSCAHCTSLMHVKNSMCHFCLLHLLSGTLEWKIWKKDQKYQIE